MTDEELFERYPRLYHMAGDGSWPSIQANGLLSVSRLLDRYGVTGDQRFAIESRRRPASVTLQREGLPPAVVRDNKPMFESVLLKKLQDGLTPRDWYEILNRKAFFWVEKVRLERLLAAYAADPQIVLTLDTRRLVERHRANVRLCRINSGQTLYNAQARGLETFLPIERYPAGAGRVGTPQRPGVAELVVEDGVPDVADFMIEVHRVAEGDWTRIA
jgi:hypothetical protein